MFWPIFVMDTQKKFRLQFRSSYKIEILNLNPKKSSTSGTIPVPIFKQNIPVHLDCSISNAIYQEPQTNCFLNRLKYSEVIPVYKMLEPLEKENYRPVNLLPHVSKSLRESYTNK